MEMIFNVNLLQFLICVWLVSWVMWVRKKRCICVELESPKRINTLVLDDMYASMFEVVGFMMFE